MDEKSKVCVLESTCMYVVTWPGVVWQYKLVHNISVLDTHVHVHMAATQGFFFFFLFQLAY